MKITKIGHCCLVIEENGVKILTDPGAFTKAQNDLTGIDVLMITHEHEDHFHVDSVAAILKNNPDILVVTNSAVGKLLDAKGIKYQVLEEGQEADIKGVHVSGHGTKHAEIWKEQGQVMNTGYMIANKLFMPGDALTNPGKPVDILALPTAGPWLNYPQVINYAKDVKPRVAFPVHDEILAQYAGFFNGWLGQLLQGEGVKLVMAENGKEIQGLE